jgi:outer membrane protein assembly factor BamA
MKPRTGTLLACVASLWFLAHCPASAQQAATDDPSAAATPSAEEIAELAEGRPIASIVLNKKQIFDTSDPRENNALFRLANRLHIITRDKTITRQLLLEPGQEYSRRLADESERILRSNQYFYNAALEPQLRDDGSVDLEVTTREVWTLKPQLSLSRSGGENKTTFGVEEVNLLGRGQSLTFERTKDVDRTSSLFLFSDRHFIRDWLSASLYLSNNSDGHSRYIALAQPFYALDTRRAGGVTVLDDERRSTLYELGKKAAEYGHQQEYLSLFGGWSSGLRQGWVRRYTLGAVYDENRFSSVPNDSLPDAVPEDRKLVYPFFGIEIAQDQFETARNREKIDRTEDFYTGTRFSARVGLSSKGFGADRDALVYAARYDQGIGSIDSKALLLSAGVNGRVENGGAENVKLALDARYYNQQSKKRLFFATAHAVIGWNLDLDNPVEIGGDTGLRGYPLRYQSGESRFLMTMEQRYFTDWYIFRLVRVGGAIFVDTGRTWGDNPVGGSPLGWLTDVGFGLRFAPTRTGFGKIVHLDIAFPLDGDPSIDSVQVLLTAKKSF